MSRPQTPTQAEQIADAHDRDLLASIDPETRAALVADLMDVFIEAVRRIQAGTWEQDETRDDRAACAA